METGDGTQKILRNVASELKIDYEVLKHLAEVESRTGVRPSMIVTSRGYFQCAIKYYSTKTKKGPKRNRTFSFPAWRRK